MNLLAEIYTTVNEHIRSSPFSGGVGYTYKGKKKNMKKGENVMKRKKDGKSKEKLKVNLN
jgi:hypothetical protein